MKLKETVNKNKVLFHHIPKTAGSYIHSILEKIENSKTVYSNLGHVPANREKLDHANNYYIISCRNPYHRFVSVWNYFMSGGGHKLEMLFGDYLRYKWKSDPERFLTYEDFPGRIFLPYGPQQCCHFTPIHDLMIFNKVEKYDFIIRHESIDEDLSNLLDGYKKEKRVNLTKHKYIQFEDLNKKCIEMINRIYRKDFIDFGYEMI